MNIRFVSTFALALAALAAPVAVLTAQDAPVIKESIKTGLARQTLQAVVMDVGSDTTIYPIHAEVNYTTIIVLPEGDKILDWLVGDKSSWVLEGAENLAYVRPAEPGKRTNINLITTKGDVFTFDVDEVSGKPSIPVDEKVILRAKARPDLTSSSVSRNANQPRFVSYDDFERARKVAQNTALAAQATIEQDRQNVATAMHFVYRYKANKKPFYVTSIYDDGKFTYIHMSPSAQEAPALYLIKDGKPELTTYTFANGVYTVNSVVSDAYLRLGKKKLRFTRNAK